MEPIIAIRTTSGTTSANKVGFMRTLGFQWSSWEKCDSVICIDGISCYFPHCIGVCYLTAKIPWLVDMCEDRVAPFQWCCWENLIPSPLLMGTLVFAWLYWCLLSHCCHSVIGGWWVETEYPLARSHINQNIFHVLPFLWNKNVEHLWSLLWVL